MLQLVFRPLVVTYESDAVGLVIRVIAVRDSLVVEQSQVVVGIVVVGGYGPETGSPYVHRAETSVLAPGVAKVSARVNVELRTNALVRGNIIRVADLAEYWGVRQRVLALNSTHLIQDLACRVVYVKLVEGTQLLGELQGAAASEQHFPGNATTCCRAPDSKVQLLLPEAHVGDL